MSGAETWKRLTEAQKQLLWSLAEHPHKVVDYYRPRKVLEDLGLIEPTRSRFQLTPEGWCALQPLFWSVPPGWTFRAHQEGLCASSRLHAMPYRRRTTRPKLRRSARRVTC